MVNFIFIKINELKFIYIKLQVAIC